MYFSFVCISLFLQREAAEDILDFWLDVQQHENLCRAYFKDVRKSGRTIKEDWPHYWDYARRRGSIYGTVVGLSADGGGTKRSTASTGEMLTDAEKRSLAAAGTGSDEKKRSTSPTPAVAGQSDLTHAASTSTNNNDTGNPPRSSTPFSLSGRTPTLFNMRRASRAPTVIPRSAAISRLDLIASAERIFYRYLSPAGNTVKNHEIYLPPALRIHNFPLSSSQEPKTQTELALMAQIPDIFHAQKEYCFRAMEQDAFPRFLRSKAFGNLTPISALIRLVLGLLILWIGLAAAFSLVFLDVQPKSKRFFVRIKLWWYYSNSDSNLPFFVSYSFRFHLLYFSSFLISTNSTQSLFSSANPKQHPFGRSPFASLMSRNFYWVVPYGSPCW